VVIEVFTRVTSKCTPATYVLGPWPGAGGAGGEGEGVGQGWVLTHPVVCPGKWDPTDI
jgi:hypothetical protein